MLNVNSAMQYLLKRALIPVSWVIRGDVTIRSAARRNRNLTVEGPGGAGLFIKQPDDTMNGARETLRREAGFHRSCSEESDFAPIRRFITHLIESEDSEAILVFELISDSITLQTQFESRARKDITLGAANILGRALGTVHRVFRSPDREPQVRLAWLPRNLPWVLRIHRPVPAILAGLSLANSETLRILQTQHGLSERLDGLGARWRSETVIHGDIRLDNVLVRPPRDGEGPNIIDLRIADWEMVQIGDPVWDLAGALQDLLVSWVSSMPVSDGVSAEEMIAQSSIPLEDLRDAARAIWAGYLAEACLAPAESDGFLLRTVAFSAARLIQSVFEAGVEADRLAGRPVILLQIGANMLAEPERAQVQLYGIPMRSTVP